MTKQITDLSTKQITGCSFPIMMPNHAIVILETVKDDMGNYIPCIAKEGETGYYTTDWEWGTDLKKAKQLADDYNAKLGLTKKEAYTIVLQSMRPASNDLKIPNFTTEMKLQNQDTCPKCQSDNIDWVESYCEWGTEAKPNQEYNVCKGVCESCGLNFEKWCEVTYSFTKWEPIIKSHRKLTEQERDRILGLHAYAPLTYKPDIDDALIELGLVQMWDGTDDAVEPNWDVKIFAENGAISNEWYDWK